MQANLAQKQNRFSLRQIINYSIKLSLLIVGLLIAITISNSRRADAAICTPPTTDLGSVELTVPDALPGGTSTSTHTYKVWVRMKAQDSNANAFLFSGFNSCIKMGDSSSISNTNWTWVDYKDGNSASKATFLLPAGTNRKFKVYGVEAGVKIDKFILLRSTDSCVPSDSNNFGANCLTTADTQAPTVDTFAAPKNGTIVSGTIPLLVGARDNVGVTKLDFYKGDQLLGAGGYAANFNGWLYNSGTAQNPIFGYDTTKATTGVQTFKARACDAAGNCTFSPLTFVFVDQSKPDRVPVAISPGYGATLKGTVNIGGGVFTPTGYASASEVKEFYYYIDNVKYKATAGAFGQIYSWDTKRVANGQHSIRAAYLNASNQERGGPTIIVNVAN